MVKKSLNLRKITDKRDRYKVLAYGRCIILLKLLINLEP